VNLVISNEALPADMNLDEQALGQDQQNQDQLPPPQNL
jgi:hypothetical protein